MSLQTTTVVLDPDDSSSDADPRLIAGRLVRGRCGRSVVFNAASPRPAPEVKPANVAYLLAAAYWVGERVEAGEFHDLADAARHFGITRARMSQIMDLTLLAPEIQEWVLRLRGIGGRCGISERSLRGLVRIPEWTEQRFDWQKTHLCGQVECAAI